MADFIEKEFNYHGHNCLISITELGYRCGYVQIQDDEPFYNQTFADINDSKILFTKLSYAGTTFPKNDGTYWLGITCDDKGSKPDTQKVKEIWGDKPMLLTYLNMQKISPIPRDGVVRTVEYVQNKLEQLVNEVIDYENRR